MVKTSSKYCTMVQYLALLQYVCMVQIYAGPGKLPWLQWVAARKDLVAMSWQQTLTDPTGHLEVHEGLKNGVHA
jgi:hypothetical protein